MKRYYGNFFSFRLVNEKIEMNESDWRSFQRDCHNVPYYLDYVIGIPLSKNIFSTYLNFFPYRGTTDK